MDYVFVTFYPSFHYLRSLLGRSFCKPIVTQQAKYLVGVLDSTRDERQPSKRYHDFVWDFVRQRLQSGFKSFIILLEFCQLLHLFFNNFRFLHATQGSKSDSQPLSTPPLGAYYIREYNEWDAVIPKKYSLWFGVEAIWRGDYCSRMWLVKSGCVAVNQRHVCRRSPLFACVIAYLGLSARLLLIFSNRLVHLKVTHRYTHMHELGCRAGHGTHYIDASPPRFATHSYA